jgi:DEAD/DEAH box helicase domain-containing protein
MADNAVATTRIKLNGSFWRNWNCLPFSEDVVPSSLFLKHRHFLVIDVETKQLVQDVGGWDHVDKLGISVACAYDSKTDQFTSYTEDKLKDLIDLCEDRLVVGYNIRGFDLPVMVPYGLDVKKLDVFDIMYDLEALTRQRFLKLDYVAKGTLGLGKSADGLQAVEWWKQGQIQKIIDYCIQDVRVTRDVFQFGRQNGFVKIQRSEDADKKSQVAVQWN